MPRAWDTGKHLGLFQFILKPELHQSFPKMLMLASVVFIEDDNSMIEYPRMLPVVMTNRRIVVIFYIMLIYHAEDQSAFCHAEERSILVRFDIN